MNLRSFGNCALLDLHKVAFLCSRNYPQYAAEKSRMWADEQREKGVCVISGYHSTIEREVLGRLLLGTQPVVIALAKGLSNLDPEWGVHIEAGRLLVITRYADSVSHACEQKCYQRNRMMIELAQQVIVAHAAPGGKLEMLCRECGEEKIVRL